MPREVRCPLLCNKFLQQFLDSFLFGTMWFYDDPATSIPIDHGNGAARLYSVFNVNFSITDRLVKEVTDGIKLLGRDRDGFGFSATVHSCGAFFGPHGVIFQRCSVDDVAIGAAVVVKVSSCLAHTGKIEDEK